MAKSLKSFDGARDIRLDPDLTFVDGAKEVAERVSAYLLTHRGEYLPDKAFGVDYKLYRERPRSEWSLIRRDLITQISALDGVQEVQDVEIDIDAVTREFVFNIRILTDAGETIQI